MLDDVIGLKNSSSEFTAERDKTGTGHVEVEEDEDFENSAMGVGKNTTSKVLETSSEAGKYEDDGKHGACFYPIPVRHFEFDSSTLSVMTEVLIRIRFPNVFLKGVVSTLTTNM